MKLVSLELINFRQFHGRQQLQFADAAGGRNVTVVHGFNGAGKTALLNAFTWCLYDETTSGFKMKDRLINELALNSAEIGDHVQCSVALTFEAKFYDGNVRKDATWCVVRDASAVKTGPQTQEKVISRLSLTITDSSGEATSIDTNQPDRVKQDRIEQLLPKSLYPFFFFDGERMEYMGRQENKAEVEKGVRTLLDIEVYERGAEHLKGPVAKDLGKEIRSGSNKQLNEATEKREQKVAEQQQLEVKAAELQANLTETLKQVQDYDARLNGIRELGMLGDQRKNLQEQQKRIIERMSRLNRDLSKAISKDGYLALANDVLHKTEAQVAAARKRGDLPAKVKPQFVDDLLRDAKCICGRPIDPGSDSARCLTQWKEVTGLADLEEQIHNVNAQIRPLTERRTNLFAALKNLMKDLQSQASQLKSNQDDESAINARIKNSEFGDQAREIKELLDRRREDLGTTRAYIEANRKNREALESEISQLNKDISKLESSEARVAIAKRQYDAALKVADAFAAIRDIQKEDARAALDERIREVWADTTIKDFEASITPEYQLTLTKRVGGQRQPVVGASTGETQVLALAFVGALVAKSRENLESNTGELASGNVFPLVMDSPFGALGELYGRKVAEWVPRLANQVVVLVSDTQWRQEVETAIRPRMGREYVLEINSAKQRAVKTSSPRRGGAQYVVESDVSAEMTIIREVT
jgi:DNA sulfur modification protein DndD